MREADQLESRPRPFWYIRYKFRMWWSTLSRGTVTDSRRSMFELTRVGDSSGLATLMFDRGVLPPLRSPLLCSLQRDNARINLSAPSQEQCN